MASAGTDTRYSFIDLLSTAEAKASISRIVQIAVEQRAGVDSKDRRLVDELIKRQNVPGYRAGHAPAAQLIRSIVDDCLRSHNLLSPFADLWKLIRSELHAGMANFLLGSELVIRHEDLHSSVESPLSALLNSFGNTWKAYRADADPTAGEVDVERRAMFARVFLEVIRGELGSPAAPVADLIEHSEGPIDGTIASGGNVVGPPGLRFDGPELHAVHDLVAPLWVQVLSNLSKLPVDAPEWGEAERFIGIVSELRDLNLALRRNRDSLNRLLSTITTNHSKTFGLFRWADLTITDLKLLSVHTTDTLLLKLDNFVGSLEKYEKLDPSAEEDISGRRAARSRQIELESKLEDAYSEIVGFLEMGEGSSTATAVDPIVNTHQGLLAEDSASGEKPSPDESPPILMETVRQAVDDTSVSVHPLDPGAIEDATTDVVPESPTDGTPMPILPEALRVELPVERDGPSVLPADDEISGSVIDDRDIDAQPLIVTGQLDSSKDEPDDLPRFLEVTADPLWDFVDQEDLAGAYWIARSSESQGELSGVPSWLLAAAAASRLVPETGDLLLADLATVSLTHTVLDDDSQRLLGAGAALYPTLLSPSTGLSGWLVGFDESLVGLGRLVDATKTFTERGVTLREMDLRGVVGESRAEAAIAVEIENARKWLDSAPHLATHYQRASDVLRFITTRTDFRTMLDIVIQDSRSDHVRCSDIAMRWGDRSAIVDAIREYDETMRIVRPRPIQGVAFDWLVKRVADGQDIAESWAELVDREDDRDDRGGWIAEQVRLLVATVQASKADAVAAIRDLQLLDRLTAVAARYFEHSLFQLCVLLEISTNGLTSPPKFTRLVGDRNLMEVLAQRLLAFPQFDRDDYGQPNDADLPAISNALVSQGPIDWLKPELIDSWLSVHDYRFLDRLLQIVPGGPQRDLLWARIQEDRIGARATYVAVRSEALEGIERALLDGIIAEDERPRYASRIEGMPAPPDVYNFRRYYAELDRVTSDLRQARESHLSNQRLAWQELRERLVTNFPDGEQRREWLELLESVLESGDTRVVDECMSHLVQRISMGILGDTEPYRPRSSRDVLKLFLDRQSEISDFLRLARLPEVADSIRQGASSNLPRALRPVSQLSGPRRTEAADAVRAWIDLSKTPGRISRERVSSVMQIIQFLGYSPAQPGASVLKVEQTGTDWCHLTGTLYSGGLSPVPQFGSFDDGRLNILCLWERPDADTIGARLHDQRLRDRDVLVLYFGRLAPSNRLEVSMISRRERLAMVLLDESLLLFLCAESEARLPTFLRCALPFSGVNPFTPFKAGDVPPEMFKGRAEMRQALLRSEESCIVYGGRQLGKSALLRQVLREFHSPPRGQFAILEDIKLIGDQKSGQPAESLWQSLRDRLIEVGFLKAGAPTKVEGLKTQILHEMEPVDRRLLILFDECDNFLDADAKRDFAIVRDLKMLMERTGRRLKVVFTGLHNVQRFHGIPNQPLAHFGRPLLVGPLEPQAAQDLIREPLEALGFRFSTPALSLRILSYTNYHPGLIQLFGRDLVNHLYSKRQVGSPPFEISQEDIEDVYRTSEVRKEIRVRFEWTLNLDIRYQAIAWTLIFEQLEDRGTYSRAFAARDVQEKATAWWPQGFDQLDAGQFRGLLDELCGLGVLVADQPGYYRLRGPNLVRLMGSEQEILDNLEGLAVQQPPTEFDADSHHAPTRSGAKLAYSPLTYGQERLLNPMRFGVGLVFASEALGLDQLSGAFAGFVPDELRSTASAYFGEVASHLESASAMMAALEECLNGHPDAERLILFQNVVGPSSIVADRIRAAVNFCSQRQNTRRRWMRVLFVFDSSATWSWLTLPGSRRPELEQRVDSVVFPHRWNDVGIRQLLEQNGKINTDNRCRVVLQATGGWPSLVRQLAESWGDEHDPEPSAKQFEADLRNCSAVRRTELRREFGLDEDVPTSLFFGLADLGDVPSAELPTALSIALGTNRAMYAEAALQYLQTMGLLVVQDGRYTVEPVAAGICRNI